MRQQIQEGFLPPNDVILHNPVRDGKLETPLDSRGLVDFSKLIQVVNATVDPNYAWPPCPKRLGIKKNNLHHLQWPNTWYMDPEDSFSLRKEFRELDISKAVLPVRFHNWVHTVTLPPPVPSDEVCHYRIEADRVIRKLFQCAKISTHLIKKDDLSKRSQKKLSKKLSLYENALEEMRNLPEEFLQIHPDEFIVTSPEDFLTLTPNLGRLATYHTVSETTRIIKQIRAA